MTAPWRLERGANVTRAGTRFSVWAPSASRVSVVVEGEGEHEMERRPLGVFEREVRGVGAGADYRFRLDGRDTYPDPVSRHQAEGVHGPSRVVDPSAFRWTDERWRGRASADLVIYELHVGTFSDEGTFAGVARRLAELRALGVTAIELMPVAEFPGTRNWGYDGVDLYAPHGAYGGPDGLRRLVDSAHDADLAVLLDVVYNHLGPEGNYLGAFGPYFTDTYHTPWGTAVNFDGAESDEVRRFVIDNALYWITEFHVDGLRLDAVHGIYDFGARHLLREMGDAVHIQGARLERTVVVIAESDLNDPRLVRTEPGDHALDAQWSDDLHHAIHARLTGERDGYYADFGDVTSIAKALRDRFVYDGRYSVHRRRRHGAPAAEIPADRFVVCIQNHDQVGNRAKGERLSTLVGFEARKVAAALCLLSPYVPLLFMGEEYDETAPFQYFVSHGDPALVEAVREGRRREFQSFGWGEGVPDPQEEETFLRSRLDRRRAETPEGRAMRALYGDLLRVRGEEPLLRPGAAEVGVDWDEREAWIRLMLGDPGAGTRGAPPERHDAAGRRAHHHPSPALAILFNLSDVPRSLTLAPNPECVRRVVRLLGTDDAHYLTTAPPANAAPAIDSDPSTPIAIPSMTASLYKVELV
jgi:maltooligosyltrehalose trehalohydrolase